MPLYAPGFEHPIETRRFPGVRHLVPDAPERQAACRGRLARGRAVARREHVGDPGRITPSLSHGDERSDDDADHRMQEGIADDADLDDGRAHHVRRAHVRLDDASAGRPPLPFQMQGGRGDAEALEIKGGVVDGAFTSVEEINALASLPNKEGMLSMLLSVLQAPVRNVAYAVKAVAESKEDGAA